MTEFTEDTSNAALDAVMLEQARQLMFHLNATRKKSRILPTSHPYVTDAIRELHQRLGSVLEASPIVTFSLIKNELYFEGHLMTVESILYREWIVDWNARGLTAVSFTQGLPLEELMRFIGINSLRLETIEERGGWEKILQEEQIDHITLRRVPVVDRQSEVTRFTIPQDAYRWIFDTIVQVFQEVQQANRLNVDVVKNMVNVPESAGPWFVIVIRTDMLWPAM